MGSHGLLDEPFNSPRLGSAVAAPVRNFPVPAPFGLTRSHGRPRSRRWVGMMTASDRIGQVAGRSLLFTCVLCCCCPAGAFGAAWAWSSRALVDHAAPLANVEQGDAVSCPSVSLCVAITESGDIVVGHDPGRARAWSAPDPALSLVGLGASISCPSTALCVAAEAHGRIATSTDPSNASSAWKVTQTHATTPTNSGQFTATSCPSVRFCVVVDDDGDVSTSHDPTRGARAWKTFRVEPGSFPPAR